MGFFEDDVYKNMDWLSQATQPLVFSKSEVFSNLPMRIDITKKQISKAITCGSSINKSSILSAYIDDKDYTLNTIIDSIYELHVDNFSVYDPINDKWPTIWLKNIHKKSIDVLIMKYVHSFINRHLLYVTDNTNAPRIREMLDLLGNNDKKLTTNNKRTLLNKLKNRYLHEILANDEWILRDADLMISFSRWMTSYIEYGNLAALTNITKLKIMTHKQQPIYSIKEVV